MMNLKQYLSDAAAGAYTSKRTKELRTTQAHPDGKPVHTIHHNGEEIGEIRPYSSYHDKKAPGSRIVSSRKNVTRYSVNFHKDKGPMSHEMSMYASMGHSTPTGALKGAAGAHQSWTPKSTT